MSLASRWTSGRFAVLRTLAVAGLIVSSAVAVVSAGDPAAALDGDPETCTTLEVQSWWFPTEDDISTAEAEAFGHAHVRGCVPYGQDLTSDTMPLTLTFTSHLGAAHDLEAAPSDTEVLLREVEIRGKNGAPVYRDILVDRFTSASDDGYLSCTPADGTCTKTNWSRNIDLVKSRRIANDDCGQGNNNHHCGFVSNGNNKQIRVAPLFEIFRSGEKVAEMRPILRFPVNLDLSQLDNGKPNANWRTPSSYSNDLEGVSWFVKRPERGVGGYANVSYTDALPANLNAMSSTAGWGAVNGDHRLPLKFISNPCTNNCLVKNMPIGRAQVFLDPNFHDDIPDVPILTNDHALTNTNYTWSPKLLWPIDPETGQRSLSPGDHKLVITIRQPTVQCGRFAFPTSPGVDCSARPRLPNWPAIDEATNTGVLIIPFSVAP